MFWDMRLQSYFAFGVEKTDEGRKSTRQNE
jgi:hypothetical protein